MARSNTITHGHQLIMQEKYDIVFYGDINGGIELDTVKKNLERLIRKDRDKINSLFLGKRVVLKRQIDRHSAEKFKSVFEKTGAVCEIHEIASENELANLVMEEKSSAPVEDAKPPEPLKACPKCGLEQVFNHECRQCGIIFDKYQENQVEPEPETNEPPISEDMAKAVAQAKMIGMMSTMENKNRYALRKLFKLARIGLLFSVLTVVAVYTTCTDMRMAAWKETLDVVIYPINGDQTEATDDYIYNLDDENFISIEDFLIAEAASYDLPLEKPVTIHLAPEITTLPPEPPTNRNPVVAAWWSLKMRYWAFKHNTYDESSDIRIFVIYKAIENSNASMEVSVGIRKGMMGIVNTTAGDKYRDYANIVITHETLHTLGATDKYDIETFMPVHPGGYADPEKEPLYPQNHGEIMAVRIPVSAQTFDMPASLKSIIVGEQTCVEIHWCEEAKK